MNVFQYSANEQAMFTALMKNLGYETFTTFYGDLSIAEWYGKEGVLDTYNNVVESWGSSIKYFTEFVMALNHKSWEHYDAGKHELSKLYADLYEKANDYVYEHFKGDDIDYYFRVTD